MPSQKIVTCCYCGTRAALVLKGQDRHELSCSKCGAPLHDMKMLRKEEGGVGRSKSKSHRPAPNPVHPNQPHPKAKKKGKRKKRKGFMRELLSDAFEEVFDAVEDIFD